MVQLLGDSIPVEMLLLRLRSYRRGLGRCLGLCSEHHPSQISPIPTALLLVPGLHSLSEGHEENIGVLPREQLWPWNAIMSCGPSFLKGVKKEPVVSSTTFRKPLVSLKGFSLHLVLPCSGQLAFGRLGPCSSYMMVIYHLLQQGM